MGGEVLSQVLVAVKSLGYSSQALHLVTTVQKQLEATGIYIYYNIYICKGGWRGE